MSRFSVGRNKAWWSISWVAGKLLSYRVIKETLSRSCTKPGESSGGYPTGMCNEFDSDAGCSLSRCLEPRPTGPDPLATGRIQRERHGNLRFH
jgi:hypothetical protein